MVTSRGGMTTAPHARAAEAGARILREGGNALEAMLAMAATVAVVYPHMNGIGGDGFWLMARPGTPPVGIAAAGRTAAAATLDAYRRAFDDAMPTRGGGAALTSAGSVAGWLEAAGMARAEGGRLPPDALLADAIDAARNGFPLSGSQHALTAEKAGELKDVPGFADAFLVAGAPPAAGSEFRQERLADTLDHLARAGFEDFYRGDVARALAQDLAAAGSPVTRADLEFCAAETVTPVRARIADAWLFNTPPPTQGVTSLQILAVADRLGPASEDGFQRIHDIVEATKQAFRRRREIRDPATMTVDPADMLADMEIGRLVAGVDRARALPWPEAATPGDTVWMGAIDGEGRAVSFIQSLYWEFGSGVVSPQTGIVWQNRGISFSLDPAHPNALAPGRLPFHTLNPAMAIFDDGRTMVYGTMGGDGQPQTQAAIFARHVWGGMDPERAVAAPRWLLGRTWGQASESLKIERDLDSGIVEALTNAGHEIELVAPRSSLMGHAGLVVRDAAGGFAGASDPRSDGAAIAV